MGQLPELHAAHNGESMQAQLTCAFQGVLYLDGHTVEVLGSYAEVLGSYVWGAFQNLVTDVSAPKVPRLHGLMRIAIGFSWSRPLKQP